MYTGQAFGASCLRTRGQAVAGAGIAMGFARRAVRKSVRRATPDQSAGRCTRRSGMPLLHARSSRVSRATYTVRHPVGAAYNKVIDAVLHAA